MVVRNTSLDWTKGQRWSKGFRIQQLEVAVEVKQVYTDTEGENRGKNGDLEPPCERAPPQRQQEKENMPVMEKGKLPSKRQANTQESECQGRGQNQEIVFNSQRVRAD